MGVADKITDMRIHARYWLRNWGHIGSINLRRGPLFMLRKMRRYPWLMEILKTNRLLYMMVHSRGGLYRRPSAGRGLGRLRQRRLPRRG